MELAEALDIVVAQTGHQRYRAKCDPKNPAYDPAYVRLVLALARGESPPVAEAPPTAASWGRSVNPAPPAIPRKASDTEVDILRFLPLCEFARLPSCTCKGQVYCQGGKRNGQTHGLETCRACLASA